MREWKGVKHSKFLYFSILYIFVRLADSSLKSLLERNWTSNFWQLSTIILAGLAVLDVPTRTSLRTLNFEIKKEVLFFISNPSIVLKHIFFIYWRKLKGKVCRAVFDICTSEKQEASAFWTWYNTFLISFSGLRINYTPLLCKNIYRVNVNFTGFDKTEVDNNYRKKFGYKFGYSLSLQFSLKELILLYILKI